MARTIDFLMQRQALCQESLWRTSIASRRWTPAQPSPRETSWGTGQTLAKLVLTSEASSPKQKDSDPETSGECADLAHAGLGENTPETPCDAERAAPTPRPRQNVQDDSGASGGTPTALLTPTVSLKDVGAGVQGTPTARLSGASSLPFSEDDSGASGVTPTASLPPMTSLKDNGVGAQSTPTTRLSGASSLSSSEDGGSTTEEDGGDVASGANPRAPWARVGNKSGSARIRTPSPESLYEWQQNVPPPPPPYGSPCKAEAVAVGQRSCIISKGSLGHPHSCAAPCKFAKKGRGCKDKEECDHCHLCVWKDLTRQRVISRGSIGHPRRCAGPCENMRRAHGCKNKEDCECCHLCVGRGRARPHHRNSRGGTGRGGAEPGAGVVYPGPFMPVYFVPHDALRGLGEHGAGSAFLPVR